MPKRASSAKIGAFVLGGLAIAIGILLAVGSGRWFTQSVERAALFDESLQGLQVGAPVTYNGIPVGQVQRITGALSVQDNQITTAVIISLQGGSITADVKTTGIGEILDRLVKSGLRAQLATQSFVTGTLYVRLVIAPEAEVYPAPPIFLNIPTIPAVASDRARFGQLATSLGEQLPQAINQLSQLVDRVSAILDEKNRANLAQALDGFAKLGSSLGETGPEIKQLVAQASTTMKQVSGLIDHADALVGNLDGTIDTEKGQINATLGELRKAVDSFNTVMGRLDSILSATRKPLSEFASNGLPQFTTLATEANATVRRIGQLVDRIQSEGAGFLLQGTQIPEYVPRSR